MGEVPTARDTAELIWLRSPQAARQRLNLLSAIDATGSISRSAQLLRISYKTAWSMLETMNNLAARPLVERSVGGPSGGGTTLTDHGRELFGELRATELQFRDLFAASRTARSASRPGRPASLPAPFSGLWDTATPVPNLFMAKLRSLEMTQVHVLAELEIGPGCSMLVACARAVVTPRMRAKGRPVFAHINPVAIVLAVGHGWRLSADNQLEGAVISVRRSGVQSVVVVRLPLETSVTALVNHESVARLRLTVGLAVTACFSAEAVTLLGV